MYAKTAIGRTPCSRDSPVGFAAVCGAGDHLAGPRATAGQPVRDRRVPSRSSHRRHRRAPRRALRGDDADHLPRPRLAARGAPPRGCGRGGGYALDRAYTLPPVHFNPREAALLLTLGRHAEQLRLLPFTSTLATELDKVRAALSTSARRELATPIKALLFVGVPALASLYKGARGHRAGVVRAARCASGSARRTTPRA